MVFDIVLRVHPPPPHTHIKNYVCYVKNLTRSHRDLIKTLNTVLQVNIDPTCSRVQTVNCLIVRCFVSKHSEISKLIHETIDRKPFPRRSFY